MSVSAPVSGNRLANAASPYLRQHALNPVAWQEWDAAALRQARAENKPIFLSIGYSACHWCHVMAHESFESPTVAAVLNEHFVNIKVDREQRPDLDEIYMQATLALNQGQGGWPMSVWLTPDCKPFFAGTYFPPAPRYGRPGFLDVCRAIARAWTEHRDDIIAQADKLADVVRNSLQGTTGSDNVLTLAVVDQTAETLARAFDSVSGGLASGATNKFPPSMALDLLFRSAARRGPGTVRRQQLIDLGELTLKSMAAGGIMDQLGGGIHRYSTDVEWHVPHFEKMLYDQALVSGIYLDAFQLTQRPLYADVARAILDYVLADLQAPAGGFYSARDADSEGVEGKYYVWTRAEVFDALGEQDAELFCAHYDVRANGNWQDPHDPNTPKNVLRALRDDHCCGKLYGITPAECASRLARARQKLLAVRAERVPPPRDEKILCEWNGLMIASLARGGCILNEPRFLAAARRAAAFLLEHQCRDGRLLRSYLDGQTLATAFLSDYAALTTGLLDLYEATFERRWFDAAVRLNRLTNALFWDEQDGGYFFTAADHELLIARSKEVNDGAVPSGNALQLMNLLRLAAMLDDAELRSRAARTMAAFGRRVQEMPWSAERFLAAVEFAHAGPVEIALVGDPESPALRALLQEVHLTYLPNRILMLRNPARPDDAVPSPLLADRPQIDGQATAYVCRNYACRQPVTTRAALAEQLASR